jgi:transcriptional regulator with XRE-family HTH domain
MEKNDDDEPRKIGRRIAAARDALKISNADIAAKIGLSQDAVKKMMTGDATKGYAKLKRLAAILGSTPNDLLGVTDGRDIDEVMAAVIHSYERLGLEPREAELYAECVREAIEEPLDQRAKPDRLLARRVLASSRTREFFAARPAQSGTPPLSPSSPRKPKLK